VIQPKKRSPNIKFPIVLAKQYFLQLRNRTLEQNVCLRYNFKLGVAQLSSKPHPSTKHLQFLLTLDAARRIQILQNFKT